MEEKKVCGIIGITSDGYPIIMPVSYTHLDVYKRQDYLSKYGEETSYNAYHLDELND